jgi:hypothetical protein
MLSVTAVVSSANAVCLRRRSESSSALFRTRTRRELSGLSCCGWEGLRRRRGGAVTPTAEDVGEGGDREGRGAKGAAA